MNDVFCLQQIFNVFGSFLAQIDIMIFLPFFQKYLSSIYNSFLGNVFKVLTALFPNYFCLFLFILSPFMKHMY